MSQQLNLRFSLVTAGCLFISATILVSSSQAQFEPPGNGADLGFGNEFDPGPFDFDDPPATAPEPSSAEQAEPEELDALTAQLLLKARRGDIALAEAIAALARTGRWGEVNSLLAEVDAREIEPSVLATMASRIEPALRLRIAQAAEIDDAARSAIEKMTKAGFEAAESDAVLTAAVAKLSDPSVDAQLAAARTLLAGGNASIRVIVNTLVSDNSTASRDVRLRTMLRLGNGGVNALKELALRGQSDVRLRALQSLARIDRKSAATELVTALHAVDSSDQEIEFAETQLSSLGFALPNHSSTVVHLTKQLNQLQRTAIDQDNDDQTTTVWVVSDSGNAVRYETLRRITAAYKQAANAAARLLRVGNLPPDVAQQVIAAELGYQLMIDPDWGDAEQVESFRDSFRSIADFSGLDAALSHALDTNDLPAAIGILRVMLTETNLETQRHWLRASSPKPSALVLAAIASSPQVRYEAATVIAGFAEQADFPGITLVKKTWSEMALLHDRPIAVLVETSGDLIAVQETILNDLGYETRIAHSVAGAEWAVNEGGDLHFLVSKTDLSDAPPIELVDRIRRLPQGRNLPIAFYGDATRPLDTQRWDEVTIVFPQRPTSPASYAGFLDSLTRRHRLPALTEIDRSIYRQTGIEAIERLSDSVQSPQAQAN